MKRLQIVTAMLLAITPAFAADPPAKKPVISWMVEGRIGSFRIPSKFQAFGNFPLSWRTIPPNPVDAAQGITQNYVIPNANIGLNTLGDGGLSVSTGIKIYDRITLSVGSMFEFNNDMTIPHGDYSELSNNVRVISDDGTRTQLSDFDVLGYYGITSHATGGPFTPFGEMEVAIHKSVSILAGIVRSRNAYNFETGFDRLGFVGMFTTVSIAAETAIAPYMGVKWSMLANPRANVGVLLIVGKPYYDFSFPQPDVAFTAFPQGRLRDKYVLGVTIYVNAIVPIFKH